MSVATKKTIALIDDEAAVRKASSSLLRSFGFAVRCFASAEEFLESKHLHENNCIVSDVQMLGMSGIDLYLNLRKQGNTTPFIFITAHGESAVRLRLGTEIIVMNKPFEGEDLIVHLDALVSGNMH